MDDYQDGERITVNRIMYFLYRNDTPGALNSYEDENQMIVTNITQVCGNKSGAYSLFSDLSSAKSLQHNV